jgi:predicted DNA-binding transcriptional regulator AlpA
LHFTKERRAIMPKPNILPASLPPRLLPRIGAAAYVCVSPCLFDEMVEAGRMPAPRKLSQRRIAWDVAELNAAVDALPSAEKSDPTKSAV